MKEDWRETLGYKAHQDPLVLMEVLVLVGQNHVMEVLVLVGQNHVVKNLYIEKAVAILALIVSRRARAINKQYFTM
jgi:hypothetical protein